MIRKQEVAMSSNTHITNELIRVCKSEMLTAFGAALRFSSGIVTIGFSEAAGDANDETKNEEKMNPMVNIVYENERR